MLRIGWKAGPEQYAPKELLEYAIIPALFNQNIYTPAMAQENGEIVGPDAVKKAGRYSSNPEDHIKFAQQYIDLGFDTLIFHSAGPDQKTFIERYARDILPKLRSRTKQAVLSV
jgi:coenzyme F420-dependent glucose-6-phosphate dehydrogenase